MGKQRTKSKRNGERSTPVNSINWETRARELVALGLCSDLILDHRDPAHPPTRRNA